MSADPLDETALLREIAMLRDGRAGVMQMGLAEATLLLTLATVRSTKETSASEPTEPEADVILTVYHYAVTMQITARPGERLGQVARRAWEISNIEDCYRHEQHWKLRSASRSLTYSQKVRELWEETELWLTRTEAQ